MKPTCALCKNVLNCYLKNVDCFDRKDEMKKLYTDKTDKKMHRISTEMESEEPYTSVTRLEEIIEFSQRMGYKKIGIAFCSGLKKEAEILHKILEREFEVFSVCCKMCSIDKSELGLPRIKWLDSAHEHEAMCNPIGQAMILNECETDINIEVGLCIGHDLIFQKHSKAPVTVFIVKDRKLAHNTAGTLNSVYYKKYVFGLKDARRGEDK